MRGTATAAFFLGTTIIGLGMGPYVTGLISDVSGNLQFALLASTVMMPVIFALGWIAYRSVPRLEQSLLERARNAGEAI
jgi:MFS family permease